MTSNLYKKFDLYILIILLGLILSATLSYYYVQTYDKYKENNHSHQLIKDETYYHWREGAKIANEVRKGKNFFLAGDITFTKPLHQRIVGLYALLTGYDLIDEEKYKPFDKDFPRVNLGGKLPFLIFQSFVYFCSLFYFAKKLIKIIPKNSFLFVILFLSFELTIFQYHSSFWTESIYFSFQLIIFGMLLDRNKNFIYNLIIGILIGFAFLQRSGAIFYIVPILICYSFLFKKKIIRPFFGIVIGFSIIAILIGFYNLYKTKVFYVYPSEGKYSIHTYFSVGIIEKQFNFSLDEAKQFEVDKVIEWAKKNNIKFNNQFDRKKIKSASEFRSYFLNEVDKNKYFDYLNYRQFEILFKNPILTLKKTIENTLHFVILNPTYNHYYNAYRGKKNTKVNFINSETHKKFIPIRITYSLIIYFLSFLGFIYLFKKKNFYELSLITLSILYYILLFGWYGKTRLFVPSLIYLSVFFGLGLDVFITYLKNKKNKPY